MPPGPSPEPPAASFPALAGPPSGWTLLLFLVAVGLGNRLAFALVAGPWLAGHQLWLPTPWLTFFSTLVVSWLFLRWEQRSLGSLGLRLGTVWLRQFLLGVGLGAGVIALAALAVHALGGVSWAWTGTWRPSSLLAGLWLYLAVACHEELRFRGYLFQRLEDGLGPWPAQIILAALFALAHWSNPGMTGATRVWASLNIGLASLLLGLGYVKTRSLALPMGAHLGWNGLQGCVLGFGVSGTPAEGLWHPVFQARPDWLTGGAFGLEASLPCALVCALACVLMANWPASKSE